MTTAGFIIQDAGGNAIYGFGSTADAAWSMVVDGVGSFFDRNGDDKPADAAREDDFDTFPATAALLAQVRKQGGAIAWDVVDGVACTTDEADAAR